MSIRIGDLKVSTVPVSVLKPYARTPRTHSKKQLRQIAASIRAFGWSNPIIIGESSLRAMNTAGFVPSRKQPSG